MTRVLPRHPVYIPSKGRWQSNRALTSRCLAREGVPFRMVVEPPEEESYRDLLKRLDFDGAELIVLPFETHDEGGPPARRWIKRYSIERGEERHWQLDDNIRCFYRWDEGLRIPAESGIALRVCEDFSDRYTNIALSGLNYKMFGCSDQGPVVINCHVYSCTLVNNAIPHEWRGRTNDDTDLCLQVLADGWCTALINVFLVDKKPTMQIKGGMTDVMYQGDGRLKMARGLERRWPHVVSTQRRFSRPQHVVHSAWAKFDNPLILKEGVVLEDLPRVDNYGMTLKAVAPVNSRRLKQYMEEQNGEAS